MWSPGLTPQHRGMLPGGGEQEGGGGRVAVEGSPLLSFALSGEKRLLLSPEGSLKAFLWR